MAALPKTLKVFLIGLPGSGKTTLGRQVADEAHIKFVDLDVEIEKEEFKKVEEIFSEKGEPYFRELEKRVLKKFCDLDSGFIMATGGGAPCYDHNLELMKKTGVVVFLDVPAKEISNRILKQSQSRPLLKHQTPDSLKDRIEFLRSQRISFYRQAHHVLTGNQITAKGIIDLIVS